AWSAPNGGGGGGMGGLDPAELVAALCGTEARDPLPVWRNGTVGPCFNQLVLGALPHGGLAVCSAFYLSVPRRSPPLQHGWTARLASALLLLLLFSGDLVLSVLLQRQDRLHPEDWLADGCALLAWSLHAAAARTLQRSAAWAPGRGPLLLVLLVLLSAPNLAFTLAAVALDPAHAALSPAEPLRLSRFVLAAVRTLPLAVYLLATAFPCVRRGARYELQINSDMDDPGGRPESTLHPDTSAVVAEDGSGCISRLLYLWLEPLLQRGQRGQLGAPSDVYQLPRTMRTAAVKQHFYRCWQAGHQGAAAGGGEEWPRPVSRHLLQEEEEEQAALSRDARLLRVLHRAFGGRYYALGMLKLAGNLLAFAGPLLLSQLVGFMEDPEAPWSRGALLTLGLFSSSLLAAVLRNLFGFHVGKVALSVRAAAITAIYGKALRAGRGPAGGRGALGEVVNLMSTDADRLGNFCQSFHELWSLPVQFSIALYLLYLQVGVAFLGGLGVALLLVPLNKLLAARILDNNKLLLHHKDARVKLVTEVLSGIRVIKFSAWEPHFSRRISACRRRELAHLKTIKYLDAVCVYTWAALPVVISILTFLTYVLLGHQLTATKVFTTLALVGMLILPLNCFPWVLSGVLEAYVSLERIQRFLQLPDQDLQAYYCQAAPEDQQVSVLLSQGSFSWLGPGGSGETGGSGGSDPPGSEGEVGYGANSGSLLLRNLDLKIPKGCLAVVVGEVGCGKSSLLAAITGELTRLGGSVYAEGRETGFALAAQEPWIQHATVRDNILFGKKYDPALYQAVVEACALSDDLNEEEEEEEVEEALEEVLREEEEVVEEALEEVLEVAEALEEVLHLEVEVLLEEVLEVEVLPRGDLSEVGENGLTLSGGQKARLALARAVYMEKDIYLLDDPLAAVDGDVAQHLMQRCILGILRGKTRILCTHRLELVEQADVVVLMERGTIVRTASKNVSDWWLSHWISQLGNNGSTWSNGSHTDAFSPSPHLLLFSPGGLTVEVRFYLTVYASIAVGNTLFTAARAFLFAYGAVRAATAVHDRLLARLLQATMGFFDVTPLGRILNRVSSDVSCVDDGLPFVLNILLASVFSLAGTLLVMAYSLPWVLLALLPLGALYHRTQSFYRHSSRELKRLCSLTLSPLYAHFSETMSGLATIRASHASARPCLCQVKPHPLSLVGHAYARPCLCQVKPHPLSLVGHAYARFEEESVRRLDRNQRCLFLSNAAMQWLDIRLQMVGVAVVTSISTIAVVQHCYGAVDPGLVGLSLSYALSITGLLSGLISSFTQTEMQMVSVERAEEYSTSLPTEPQDPCTTQLPASWPQHGRLEFCGAVLCYREGLPRALDGVSLLVRPGEKVGVVGRTGSGKSSLFLALFRLAELQQGRILLDGLDISTLGLAQLRSRLAIIPQDPFLFSGSRQLLCLTRALLTAANVLCIDEATASVDQQTDRLLQETIRDRFRGKTVLTIAHRINTIMDSDRVLVMHAGKVVEFDTPAALLQNDQSLFHRLVGGAGD
ncbi:hypothetical protein CRUP_001068, partial [Coryphaenoides rupestris]